MSDGLMELRELATALREAGEIGLKRELAAGLRAAAKPLKVAVRNAALERLPKSGGLNEQVAAKPVAINTALGARTVYVRLSTTAPDTGQTDRGFVNHPTFGRRGKGQWSREDLPLAAGWWSTTLASKTPEVAVALDAAMARVEAKLMGVGL